MAINAYTGLMGSGKSYEVVENVILPAILQGRRVVTNVSGLKPVAINAYLVEKFNADASALGEIVQIGHEVIEKPQFFPLEGKEGELPVDGVVKGGDLVVVDEVWRFWAVGCKISAEHMTFFRMHRHFVNPDTLGTCDLVIIAQDIGDIHRQLKSVVENTYRMTKLKALGTNKSYRVDIYARYKTVKSSLIRDILRNYNPEIFKLYDSYSQSGGAGGKEGAIDKRSTIWNAALFKIVLPLGLLLSIGGFVVVYRFFHSSGAAKPAAVQASAAPVAGGVVQSAPVPVGAQPVGMAGVDSDWRVKGHFSAGGRHVVLVARGDAVRALNNPVGFFYDGLRITGVLDGKSVTSYTGVAVDSHAGVGGLQR